VVGIVSLGLSDEVAMGWWQGTLQALGVGLVVGGLVDVLAISKLNRVIQSASDKDRAENKRQAEAFVAQIPDGEVVQIPAREVERYLRVLRDDRQAIELRAAVLHRLNLRQRSFLLDRLDRTLRDQLVDAGVYRD
jgi:hypothetical protein